MHGDRFRVAAEKFGDHEGMSPGHVLRWACQFDDEDLSVAVRLLERVSYYNTTNIRAFTRQLIQIAELELPIDRYPAVAIVPVGGPGSGSQVVSRAVREAVKGTRFRLIGMLDLTSAARGEYSAVLFLDDFGGTGDTLRRWWENVEALVRPLDAEVVFGLLVLNQRARSVLEEIASRVLCTLELDDAANVFDDASRDFDPQQREVLMKYAARTGCAAKYLRGYGNCGLIVSFRHGCPNNSIPTLWHETGAWRALFSRKAV